MAVIRYIHTSLLKGAIDLTSLLTLFFTASPCCIPIAIYFNFTVFFSGLVVFTKDLGFFHSWSTGLCAFLCGPIYTPAECRAKSVRKMSTLFVLALKMYSNFHSLVLQIDRLNIT